MEFKEPKMAKYEGINKILESWSHRLIDKFSTAIKLIIDHKSEIVKFSLIRNK